MEQYCPSPTVIVFDFALLLLSFLEPSGLEPGGSQAVNMQPQSVKASLQRGLSCPVFDFLHANYQKECLN